MSIQVIHKIALPLALVGRENIVELPRFSLTVSVGEQHGMLAIWYMCDPTQPMEERTFIIVGTGHEFDAGLCYYGTAMFHGGDLVLHVLERVRL